MKLIQAMSFISFFYCSTTYASYEMQRCYENAPKTTPTHRFVLDDMGLAADTVTGLLWMRCLAGQHWTGSNCDGEPLDLGLSAALAYSDSFEYAGKTNWRIPNVKELTSIIELSCVQPALNPAVFPNSWFSGYNEYHYTSTPIVNQEDLFWCVLFSEGRNFPISYYSFEEQGTHFRLVRDIDK